MRKSIGSIKIGSLFLLNAYKFPIYEAFYNTDTVLRTNYLKNKRTERLQEIRRCENTRYPKAYKT